MANARTNCCFSDQSYPLVRLVSNRGHRVNLNFWPVSFYLAFIAKPTPRSAIERELIENKAHVKAQPYSAQAHFKLGLVYWRLGAYTKAKRELERTIELDSKFISARYAIGLVYRDQGKTKEAIEVLRDLLKKAPRFELLHFELGRLYLKEKKYKEAIEVFKKATEIFPAGADRHYLLGLAYEKSGQTDLAVQEYQQALKFIPDYKEAKNGLERLQKKNR